MLGTIRRRLEREDPSTVSWEGERDALVDEAVRSEDSNYIEKKK